MRLIIDNYGNTVCTVAVHRVGGVLFFIVYPSGQDQSALGYGNNIHIIAVMQTRTRAVPPSFLCQKMPVGLTYRSIQCRRERAAVLRLIRRSIRAQRRNRSSFNGGVWDGFGKNSGRIRKA